MSIVIQRSPQPDPGSLEAIAQEAVVAYIMTGQTLSSPDNMVAAVVKAVATRQVEQKEQYDDLKREFAYATECQLATVEGFTMRSRPPARELNRAQTIANINHAVCRRHQIRGEKCPRLKQLLDEDALTCTVQILDIGEETARAAKESNLKAVEARYKQE